MASTVTVTGVNGPGLAVTALVINNVKSFSVNCENTKLSVVAAIPPGVTQDFDITGKTSLTLTQSGGNYTLTVA
jgi:hypothetical protein